MTVLIIVKLQMNASLDPHRVIADLRGGYFSNEIN